MNIKAGIVIEVWKLPVFSKNLQQAGLHYEQHNGPGKDIYTLTVEVELSKIFNLQKTIETAQKQAAEEKK